MKRARSITLGALLLCALSAHEAAAQWNVARFASNGSRVYATFGLDPAVVSSVGYGQVVGVAGHDYQLTADAGVVTAGMDARDFRARLGLQTSLVRWKAVHVTGSATFITRGTENTVYRGLNFGADFSGAVGVYRHGWFAAAEAGFDKAVITHVRHTRWYRENHYADARDGWYLNAGGNYHTGVAAGLSLGRAEVVGRVGILRTERFNQPTPPLYASVGVGFGF